MPANGSWDLTRRLKGLKFELHGKLVIIWERWVRKWYWPISRSRCTNPRRQVVEATKVCTTAPNICGSSEWNLFHVTFLKPWILRWTLHIWKVYVPLFRSTFRIYWFKHEKRNTPQGSRFHGRGLNTKYIEKLNTKKIKKYTNKPYGYHSWH